MMNTSVILLNVNYILYLFTVTAVSLSSWFYYTRIHDNAYTVFDLVSGLFAYVILDKKTP